MVFPTALLLPKLKGEAQHNAYIVFLMARKLKIIEMPFFDAARESGNLVLIARKRVCVLSVIFRSAHAICLILAVLVAGVGSADEPTLNTPAQEEAPTAFASREPAPVLEWGAGDGRRFLVPAYEITAFELALNRFDHATIDSKVYAWPDSNFRENTHHKWVVDNDAFATNQFLHPYQR
jgi:hypothetical protein